MQDYVGEKRTNSSAIFYFWTPHTDMKMLDEQQERLYNSSAVTLYVIWKTCNLKKAAC